MKIIYVCNAMNEKGRKRRISCREDRVTRTWHLRRSVIAILVSFWYIPKISLMTARAFYLLRSRVTLPKSGKDIYFLGHLRLTSAAIDVHLSRIHGESLLFPPIDRSICSFVLEKKISRLLAPGTDQFRHSQWETGVLCDGFAAPAVPAAQ